MPGLGICSFVAMHTDPKTVTVGLPLLASVVELANGRGSHDSWQLMALMALPTRSCQRSKHLPLAKAVSGSCCTHSTAQHFQNGRTANPITTHPSMWSASMGFGEMTAD
ncbi:hypothetical protein V8C34DRAFT_221603 [Trichoderma compactum]